MSEFIPNESFLKNGSSKAFIVFDIEELIEGILGVLKKLSPAMLPDVDSFSGLPPGCLLISIFIMPPSGLLVMFMKFTGGDFGVASVLFSREGQLPSLSIVF